MSECPCGCGVEVPQKASSIWRKTAPYWEWICSTPSCSQRQTRMLNQSGDATCSWCGSKRSFVGHFKPGGTGSSQRRTVAGEIVRSPHADSFIRPTPAHLIRPFQDVT